MFKTFCSTIGLGAVLACGLSFCSPSMACQIPVFRYALENWEPEPFDLFLIHRGELGPADAELLKQLQETLDKHGVWLNLELKVVDLAKDTDPLLDQVFGPDLQSMESTQLVLIYPFAPAGSLPPPNAPETDPPTEPATGLTAAPEGLTPALPSLPVLPTSVDGQPTPTAPGLAFCPDGKCGKNVNFPRLAWMGDLSAENIRLLPDSPIRQEIATRLLDGHSAVWVLVECADKKLNDAAVAQLEATLSEMHRDLTLPPREELEADEHYQADTKVELRIEFSVIRIPYQRGDEAIFASTLLATEAMGVELVEPLIVPIFGRGRAYFPLVGEQIDAISIEDSCRFLIGDCSCEVKEANPGVDALMAVAWKDRIKGKYSKEPQMPDLTGIGSLPPGPSDQFHGSSTAPTVGSSEPADKPEQGDDEDLVPDTSTGDAESEPEKGANNSSQLPESQLSVDESEEGYSRVLTWIVAPATVGLLMVLALAWMRFGS